MLKALAQAVLILVLLALTTVLLPVSNAVWRQTLTIRADVSGAAATATPTPTASATATVTPTSTPTVTPEISDFTTTKVMVTPDQLQVPAKAGETVTARVSLPKDTRAEQVVSDSLRICVGDGPCGARSVVPTRVEVVKDAAGPDILELTFDRQAVLGLIDSPKPGRVRFAVSGRLLVGSSGASKTSVPGRTVQSPISYLEFGGSDEVELLAAPIETPSPSATPATPPPSPTPEVAPSAAPSPTAAPPTAAPTSTPPAPTSTASPTPSSTPTIGVASTATSTATRTATAMISTPMPSPAPALTPAPTRAGP